LTTATPPARTLTPSRSKLSPPIASTSAEVLRSACFSPPVTPAMTSPDRPSSLNIWAAAGSAAVQAEVTDATSRELRSRATTSLATDVAAALRAPSGEDTVMSNCASPWSNRWVSSAAALADSEPGSWNPPAASLPTTGTPKIPAATRVSAAIARIRRGAAMAARARPATTPG
jgi:hypothetical protein